MTKNEDFDPISIRREAAMFYGLFLRGHTVETLRKDIDVPRETLTKWTRNWRQETNFRDNLERIYHYRKQVLAVFEELVTSERHRDRLQ